MPPRPRSKERGPVAQLPPSVAALKGHWEAAGLAASGLPQGYHDRSAIHAALTAIKALGRADKIALTFQAYAQALRRQGKLAWACSFSSFFWKGYHLEYAAAASPAQSAPSAGLEPQPQSAAQPPANAIEPHLLGCLRNRLAEALFERIGQDAYALASGLQVERLPGGQWLGHVSAALKEALLRACAPQIAQEIGLFWADSALEVWPAS
jgi:hypothetical protein